MSDIPQKRFHGKVLVRRGDTEIHVNVFDDNREVVYLEIAQAIAQFSADIRPATAAQRELANAAMKRNMASGNGGAAVGGKPSPAPKATRTNADILNVPVCQECGSTDSMVLISWYDKKERKNKKAWKCQACGKWDR